MVHSPIDSGKLLNGVRLSAASGAAKSEFTNMAARNRAITIMNRGVSLSAIPLFLTLSPGAERVRSEE
jgi:environmental stress-induced protein Ves